MITLDPRLCFLIHKDQRAMFLWSLADKQNTLPSQTDSQLLRKVLAENGVYFD